MSAGIVLRDPLIEFGRFRVLPRSDGKFIVYDPERPFGRRTVSDHVTQDAAKSAAKKLHEESQHVERENASARR